MAEDGIAEGVEGGDEAAFLSVAVLIAQGVKACVVGHFGKMGKFVPHYVIPKFLRHKHKHMTELDFPAAVA